MQSVTSEKSLLRSISRKNIATFKFTPRHGARNFSALKPKSLIPSENHSQMASIKELAPVENCESTTSGNQILSVDESNKQSETLSRIKNLAQIYSPRAMPQTLTPGQKPLLPVLSLKQSHLKHFQEVIGSQKRAKLTKV